MGILDGLLSGGAALNVLGGMAMGFNQKEAEASKLSAQKELAKEQDARQKELIKFEANLKKKYDIERDLKLAKEKSAEKIELAKIKAKEQLEKNKPKGFRINPVLQSRFPNINFFQSGDFYYPKKSEYKDDPQGYFAAVRAIFPPEFFERLSNDDRFTGAKSTDTEAVNLYGAATNLFLEASLDSMQTVQQQTAKGDKSFEIRVTDLPLINMYMDEYGMLGSLFEQKYGVNLQSLKKELTNSVGENGVVDEPKRDGKDTVIKVIPDNSKYYQTIDPENKGGVLKLNKQQIDSTVKNLKHPLLTGLSLTETYEALDGMVQNQAPRLFANGQGHGGEIIVRGVAGLKEKLRTYTSPVGTVNNPEAIRKFFLETNVGQLLIANPSLAINVVAMALPNSVPSAEDFQPIGGGVGPSGQFSKSEEFKRLKQSNEDYQRGYFSKKLGFEKYENLVFKQRALSNVLVPTRELINLLDPRKPVDQQALVGLAGKFRDVWRGVQGQYASFLALSSEVIKNQKNPLFTNEATQKLREIRDETNQFLKDSTDPSKSKLQQEQALFNYFAGVLTFTMAASVQGGSEGSVDSRTISDKDVQLWKNILNLGTNLAYRDGALGILQTIYADANAKSKIMAGMLNDDLRIKSAAKILDKSYFGTLSPMNYRDLEEKYGELILSDKTKVRGGDPKGALFQGKTIFKEDTEFSPKNIKAEEKQKADVTPKVNTMPVVKNPNE